MSSILEALEKAEQERIRGASTSGLQPPRRAVSERRYRPWVVPVVAFGVLLVAAAAGWFYLRTMPQPTAPAPGVPEVAATPVAPPAPTAAVPAPAPVLAAPVPAPVPATPPLSLREQLRRNAVPSAKPLIEEAHVQPPPKPAATTQEPVSGAVTERVVTPAATSGEGKALAVNEIRPPATSAIPPARVSTPVPAPTALPVPMAPPQTPAEPQPVAAEPEEQVPLVWELPQTLREKVLKLKSSVHVYNEVPAQRFVIINMHRYVEGDTLPPDGFRLARIDRDGVVIDYGNGQVRLPRR